MSMCPGRLYGTFNNILELADCLFVCFAGESTASDNSHLTNTTVVSYATTNTSSGHSETESQDSMADAFNSADLGEL